eukprot:3456698-Alexandrium_andersonii.AAC.1
MAPAPPRVVPSPPWRAKERPPACRGRTWRPWGHDGEAHDVDPQLAAAVYLQEAKRAHSIKRRLEDRAQNSKGVNAQLHRVPA